MKVKAVIHSKNSVGEVDLLYKCSDNDYVVRTEEGIYCHAIFNIFNGYYYADDLYAKCDEKEKFSPLGIESGTH